MRILFVSTGIGPWPNNGWGACENLVADFAWALEQLGQTVLVIHSEKIANDVRVAAEEWKPDIIHCEYDDHVLHLVSVLQEFPKIRVLLTTHYAFLSQPYKLVQDGYMDRFIFASELASNTSLELAVLSQAILKTYRDFGNVPPQKLWVFPNGTRVDQIRFSVTPQLATRAVCLGKVESRKCQNFLKNCPLIDFIGPIKEDEQFAKEFSELPQYKGKWTRSQMYDSLTEYGCLVLMSTAEAHPLVIGEAIAAGCSIICNEISSANLPRNKPWIRILPDESLKKMEQFNQTVAEVLGENAKYRKEIRSWAEQNLDWRLRAETYIKHFDPSAQFPKWRSVKAEPESQKIALVGPGIMSIPPQGWGAVEQLIWDYSEALTKKNYNVTIINTPNRDEIVQKVNEGDFDVVHVHYDVFWDVLDRLNAKLICVTSHYPYIDQQAKWARDGFDKVFQGICDVVNKKQNVKIFCLCEKDKQVFEEKVAQHNTFLLRNGVNVDSFECKEMPEKIQRSLVLAKIEPRKRQHLTYWLPQVDYAGRGFLQHQNFLGELPHSVLNQKLTEYGNLVLLSEGESAPLVVKEAMAAGLGLVLSESAGNEFKDLQLPWVTIIPEHLLGSSAIIENAIESNRVRSIPLRQTIREWVREHFDWSHLVDQYCSNLKAILEKCS